MELMEAVIPQDGEVPFRAGNRSYKPVPYADAIYREVSKKIAKYGFKHDVPIDLLIYTTHEQYNPNGAAIEVLQRYFLERNHPFQHVFFLVPSSEERAKLGVLFDYEYPLNPRKLSELEGSGWINVVSSGFQTTKQS